MPYLQNRSKDVAEIWLHSFQVRVVHRLNFGIDPLFSFKEVEKKET